jgi:hypothetical protein
VDRFQPVAGIGQGARHDHAHGVIEIRFAHLGIDVNLLDVSILAVGGSLGFSSTIFSLSIRGIWHKKDTKDEFLRLRVLTNEKICLIYSNYTTPDPVLSATWATDFHELS